ncbi:MAG: cytochrome c [Yoonia sp.]|nr:cytochrome c [Yoonia sp.]
MFKSIWTYVVIAVPFAGLALLAFWPSQSPVGHDMTTPDTGAIVQGDPIASVAVPASFSENAQIGKNVFEAACADCHGKNAAGQNGIAPPLVHKIYEPSHHGDQAFWSAAQNGVRSHHWTFGNMPPVEGLTRSDVGYIVAYVRELQRENGIN